MSFHAVYGYANGDSHPETSPVYAETDGTNIIANQYTADMEEESAGAVYLLTPHASTPHDKIP